jgi:hypothetical protein
MSKAELLQKLSTNYYGTRICLKVVDGAPYGMAIIRRIKCKHADKVWRYFAAMNGSRLEWL